MVPNSLLLTNHSEDRHESAARLLLLVTIAGQLMQETGMVAPPCITSGYFLSLTSVESSENIFYLNTNQICRAVWGDTNENLV